MTEVAEKAVWAIGLMSGTSMDGIDAAMIKTDGQQVLEFGPAYSVTYDPAFRASFKQYLGKHTAPADIVKEFTAKNAEAALAVLRQSGKRAEDISVVGFHGQTLFHDAPNSVTVQVGDGQFLADLMNIPVVSDFRSRDVENGGEGAPFAPLYHRALASAIEKPVMVLNLGGVANVTYMDENTILAFDTGPASAMIDDWVQKKGDIPFDMDGKLAFKGTVDVTALSILMDNSYFDKPAPKSLDRNDFSSDPVQKLSLEDGAATLTTFTIETVLKSLDHCPSAPQTWLVTGGGRKNTAFMQGIAERTGASVKPVEEAGWRGDELEAEAFAFLAVRSRQGAPLSLPTTTRVREPMTGGQYFTPSVNQKVG